MQLHCDVGQGSNASRNTSQYVLIQLRHWFVSSLSDKLVRRHTERTLPRRSPLEDGGHAHVLVQCWCNPPHEVGQSEEGTATTQTQWVILLLPLLRLGRVMHDDDRTVSSLGPALERTHHLYHLA